MELGVRANAGTEPRRTIQGGAITAKRSSLKASGKVRFFVMTPAGKPRAVCPGSRGRLGLPDYRGQNPRFMRLFHRGKSRMVSQAILGQKGQLWRADGARSKSRSSFGEARSCVYTPEQDSRVNEPGERLDGKAKVSNRVGRHSR